ncbi:DTW domain-containing protein [bacterium]|nr:DTW domain-containing protein [bacterium]
MDIEQYQLKKAQRLLNEPKYRVHCRTCEQPDFCCYCNHVVPFDPQIHFVILIHPVEAKRRIATGRMSHLCLNGSHLIKGQDFSNNSLVNDLLLDPTHHSVILYPGHSSQNISLLTEQEKENLTPQNKPLRIFVIDGTWATARKMVRQSVNLKTLPRICFSPPKPSTFRVRKQPSEHCYSTIEAIHHTIELLRPCQNRVHDNLLSVFDSMVERQLIFIRDSKLKKPASTYRKPTKS